jgi:hypothetical protein
MTLEALPRVDVAKPEVGLSDPNRIGFLRGCAVGGTEFHVCGMRTVRETEVKRKLRGEA